MKHTLTFTSAAVIAIAASAIAWAAPARQAGTNRAAAGPGCLVSGAQQVTLNGKVTQLVIPERGSRGGAVQFQLEGRTVRLGPAHVLDEKGWRLADGDLVTVTGWAVTKDGASVVVARDITRAGQTLTWRNQDGAPTWRRGPGMGQGACNGQGAPKGQGNGARDRKRDGSCISGVSQVGGIQLARYGNGKGNGQGNGQGNGTRSRKRDGSCGLSAQTGSDIQLARYGNGQGNGQGNGTRSRKRDGSCGLTAQTGSDIQLARYGNGQGNGQGNGTRSRKRDGSCGLTAQTGSDVQLALYGNGQGNGQGNGTRSRKRDGSCGLTA